MLDLRPYKTRAARLSDFLPWAGLVAPGIVLKDGASARFIPRLTSIPRRRRN